MSQTWPISDADGLRLTAAGERAVAALPDDLLGRLIAHELAYVALMSNGGEFGSFLDVEAAV